MQQQDPQETCLWCVQQHFILSYSSVMSNDCLQDPTNLAKHNMSQFDHVKRDIKLVSDAERAELEVLPSTIQCRKAVLCAFGAAGCPVIPVARVEAVSKAA